EARRLDPNVPTSVEQTIMMSGDIERLLALERRSVSGGDAVIRVIGLGFAGRTDEARQRLEEVRRSSVAAPAAFRTWLGALEAGLDRRVTDVGAGSALAGLAIMDDPEAIFQEGAFLCDVGEHERGLALLRRAVERGYTVVPALAGNRAFDGLR